jgi:hypothetical protein
LPTPTSLQLTTPTVTLEATPSAPLEATPILEVVPTLSGPFPVGPKIVYSENSLPDS